MTKKKYIGRPFEYSTFRGYKRVAICKGIEFHQELGKPLFIGETLYGNKVRLTKDEINRFM